MRTEVYKALALIGAALISLGGVLAAADWSDYWMHDCHAGAVGGCSSIALPMVSAMWYVTPYLLISLLGLAVVFAGLRRLSGVTRTKYIVWSVLVGVIVLMGLYSYVSWVMWMVPPPSGASTTTSTTTVE